jgi:hypothetical protein
VASIRIFDHLSRNGYGMYLIHYLVIVTTAYPFWLEHTGESWKHEKACFNLVGRFIDSLP